MANKSRPTRSVAELKEASSHLFYEVDMLFGTIMASSKGQDLVSGYISNALVESFVIHLRNLMDFLYSKKDLHKTDIIAEDFFPDPQSWTQKRSTKSDLLERCHGRAHKEISHLTYDRLSVANKNWEYGKILKDILPALETFSSLAPSQNLDPRLAQLIQAIRQQNP